MPAPLEKLKLGCLEVGNPPAVQVKKLEIGDYWGYCTKIIIMGPTGSGKSSFVEALAGPLANASVTNLSSGTLEGFTQEVSAYMVKGISKKVDYVCEYKICLIDTPGFADDKISTLEIITKVQAFLRKTHSWKIIGSGNIPHIIYFTPVTCTRLAGSQRKVVQTFKDLTGAKAGGGVTVVTTMWDKVWGESAKRRAQSNFKQLKTELWKDFIDKKTRITKFYNTQASALQVLDVVLQRTRQVDFNIESAIKWGTKPSKAKFGADMYTDLVERIIGLHLRKAAIHSFLPTLNLVSASEKELIIVLEKELGEVHKTLTKFEQQLQDFGPPPPTLRLPACIQTHPLPRSLAMLPQENARSNCNSVTWAGSSEPLHRGNMQTTSNHLTGPQLTNGGLIMRIQESTKRLVKNTIRRDNNQLS